MTIKGRGLAIAFSRALGKVIVHLSGSLVANTAQVLDARLVDVIDGQGNRDLVLDLTELTRIDDVGLAVLLDALKRMQGNGGELVLNGPPSHVAEAIAAAGLDQTFVVTRAWSHPAHGSSAPLRDRLVSRGRWN